VLIVVGIIAGWLATKFMPFGPAIKGLYILSDAIGAVVVVFVIAIIAALITK
jgi:uncharacterized membrane protein YeaQ/YmgE (transglycosylase-associated protein family)